MKDIASEGLRELLRPELRSLRPYGAPQIDVPVRLNTNENAYEIPDKVAAKISAALHEQVADLNRYPDREFSTLRASLASYLRSSCGAAITPEQIWAANGSNEVIQHILQAFGGHGRRALGFVPSYSMHELISTATGTNWVNARRDRKFDLTARSACEQVREHDPDIVFLCSPNNPTGTALGSEVITEVLQAARGIVVVDEAYFEFARSGTASALLLLEEHPRLIVSRTMSKAFAFAGVRLGYLAADPAITDMLRLVRLPYHLSSLTQAAAIAALAQSDVLLKTVQALCGQRDRIAVSLTEFGLDPIPSDANFVLFGGLPDAPATWRALLADGILVRDVAISHHLRVSAGTEAETTAFLRALAQHLGEAVDVIEQTKGIASGLGPDFVDEEPA